MKPRQTCIRMRGKGKYGKGKEQLIIPIIIHHVSNMVEAMSWNGYIWGSNKTGSVLFIEAATADSSTRMNSEVFYMAILSNLIQPNVTKLIGRCFTVQLDNDPKHTAEATQDFLKSRKWKILRWLSQLFIYLRQNWGRKDPQKSNGRWLQRSSGKAPPGRKLRILMSMSSRLQGVIYCKEPHPNIEKYGSIYN